MRSALCQNLCVAEDVRGPLERNDSCEHVLGAIARAVIPREVTKSRKEPLRIESTTSMRIFSTVSAVVSADRSVSMLDVSMTPLTHKWIWLLTH